ncbi:MAG TPA: elongation factor G [Pirellulales bacterium]|nr:elongation factor G [Pirellulales bacterium]
MQRDLHKLRNIGIIAHIDAGKTTVTERMLFLSGAKHRVGEVDKGTTDTDSDPEEQERGITIYAACVTFPWKDVTVNLLDTPGHVDFTAEVERCLRVLDGAVVVFSAREGVEAQSETVWRQADKYKVPRVAFINKLDREGADFEAVYTEISKRLAAHPVAIQIPVGQGPPHVKHPFRGIIDLIEMKLLTFGGDRQSREQTAAEIPDDLRPRAEEWRTAMLEKLYDYSNELMELALQEEPIPPELIRQVLRKATVSLQVQPVLCGSALHGIGVQPVLDAVQYYLPSPLDVPPVEGRAVESGKDGGEKIERRKPSPDEPFCGLVFKVLPAKTGDMYWIRVYSGSLKQNSRVLNSGKNFKENVSQLWIIHATKREEQIDSVQAGDIVGAIGPRQSITGDTLCDPKAPLLLETIQFPETVISAAVEPESTADRKKLGEVLEMLKRQDPTFRAHENEETGQTLISGMGELHLEVIQHRLQRDFNLNVRVHKPRVSYKETVNATAEALGKCNRQIGGQTLFAEVKVRVTPLHKDEPARVFTNWFTEDSAKQNLIQLVLAALKEAAEGGGLKGCPLWSCSLELLQTPLPEPLPGEVALRIAAADAFTKVLQAAGVTVLEPIMRVEVTTPEEHLGDVINDLQQRRAIISSTENRGGATVLEAEAPLSAMFGYSAAVRSLSQGRASFSMEPLKYGPAPPEVQEGFI